ncbi:MAG: hypothetical protein JNK27_06205 [Chitinophagaceae bacterium]|nr:hypothetical protein [Chitinophagaceae bacterium]
MHLKVSKDSQSYEINYLFLLTVILPQIAYKPRTVSYHFLTINKQSLQYYLLQNTGQNTVCCRKKYSRRGGNMRGKVSND